MVKGNIKVPLKLNSSQGENQMAKSTTANNSSTEIIRDLELHWANVYKPHNPFGTEIWDIQIRTTDKNKVEELAKHGIKLKEHDEGYFFGNVKRKTVNAKGEPMKAPEVFDAGKKIISEPIGNGSKGHIKVFSYDYKVGGRKGRTAMLTALQVVDLVPYKAATQEVDFDVENDDVGF